MSKNFTPTAIIFKSIFSSSLGNILEWYEYTLYAYFATIIAKLFFPISNHAVSMLFTFATFAIGLTARPIGGLIFGYMGDRYSRKNTLAATMLLMSIPTMGIGLLPTYEQIGIMAPILLLLLRIMQGLALGGEFGSSCVYLYESVPENKRGFFGTMALTGVGFGLILSACTIFIIEALFTQENLYAYAWRIPFFISVLASIVAYYIRRNLQETIDFNLIKQTGNVVKNPFLELLKNYKLTLINLFSIFLTTQVAFFVVFIYGKSLMIDFLHYDNYTAGKFNLFTVISYTFSTIIFGYLSDKINKKYLILFGVTGIFCTALPFINILKQGNSFDILFICLLLGALIGAAEGTLNPLVASSFPANIRTTAVAFCWNFTAILFGGTAPIISMWLIDKAGTIDIIAYYLIAVSGISIFSLILNFGISAKVSGQNRCT